MTDDICGEPTEDGDGPPCKRAAGWGRDANSGPCTDHEDDEVRPRKLSHDRQESIALALEAGVSFKNACESNGIARDTGHRWLRLGEEQEEGALSDFHDRVTRAKGVGKQELSNSIVRIAKENGNAQTLLNYLQYVEGGEAGQEAEDLAGLNLVVPDIAQREDAESVQ